MATTAIGGTRRALHAALVTLVVGMLALGTLLVQSPVARGEEVGAQAAASATDASMSWRLSEYTNTAALKCEALAPDYLFCDHELLTESSSKLWRGPWRWVVYDVQTAKQALEVASRGARLVETSAIRDLLREERKTSL